MLCMVTLASCSWRQRCFHSLNVNWHLWNDKPCSIIVKVTTTISFWSSMIQGYLSTASDSMMNWWGNLTRIIQGKLHPIRFQAAIETNRHSNNYVQYLHELVEKIPRIRSVELTCLLHFRVWCGWSSEACRFFFLRKYRHAKRGQTIRCRRDSDPTSCTWQSLELNSVLQRFHTKKSYTDTTRQLLTRYLWNSFLFSKKKN